MGYLPHCDPKESGPHHGVCLQRLWLSESLVTALILKVFSSRIRKCHLLMWHFSRVHHRELLGVSLGNGALSILLALESSTGVCCRNQTLKQLLGFSFISLFYVKESVWFTIFSNGKPQLKSPISKPRQRWLVTWWIPILLSNSFTHSQGNGKKWGMRKQFGGPPQ